MLGSFPVVYILLGVTILLLLVIMVRPSIEAATGGRMVVFVGFFALPFLCAVWGMSDHMERSKQTSFCLSCHIMGPYGRSLYRDDAGYIPAAHFQNHRIPPDEACYTCHTDYAMFGTVRV